MKAFQLTFTTSSFHSRAQVLPLLMGITSLVSKNLADLNFAFGKTLRNKRKKREMTQADLSEKANLTRAFISQLENGLRDPSYWTIFKLSFALKVKPSVFIDEVEHSFNDKGDLI